MDTFKGVSRAIIIVGLGIMSATFYLGNTQRYEIASTAGGGVLYRLDKRTGHVDLCRPMGPMDKLSVVCFTKP